MHAGENVAEPGNPTRKVFGFLLRVVQALCDPLSRQFCESRFPVSSLAQTDWYGVHFWYNRGGHKKGTTEKAPKSDREQVCGKFSVLLKRGSAISSDKHTVYCMPKGSGDGFSSRLCIAQTKGGRQVNGLP